MPCVNHSEWILSGGSPMTDFRGLTWDHPRGRLALEAASRDPGLAGGDTLTWSAHSLEAFEAVPIEDLAASYDLIVLDHPHLGDASRAGCLRPLDEIFERHELLEWAASFVGPTFDSYVWESRVWALPLDAATQVSARRADSLRDPPRDWAGARAVARRLPVAVSLAGPHAFLTWCSILVGEGSVPCSADARFCDPDAGRMAVELLRDLAQQAPARTRDLNPIALLELMTSSDAIAYIPLVYGYVGYAAPGRPRRVAFGPPPSGSHGAGSTVGGTGVAVSSRCHPSASLLEHLRWLVSRDTQTSFIPAHAGQPARNTAWSDETLDLASGGFYGDTRSTIARSWVRPRLPGYVPFQSWASRELRAVVVDGAPAVGAIRRINERYARLASTTKGDR